MHLFGCSGTVVLPGGFQELPGDNSSGLEHNFQIEKNRPVLEIEQVHRDHLVEGRFIFTVYLPVSGQPRKTVYTFPLPRLVMSKFIWRARPRTNQAHFTANHVEDLRQLIQAACTQKSAKRGEARIADSIQLRHWTIDPDQFSQVVFVRLCLSPNVHRSELPERKMPSSKTDALLSVEDWARRSDSRYQHEQYHQRQPNRQRNQNTGDVEREFPVTPPNASASRADRCRGYTRRDSILFDQTIIRRSDCVSSLNKSDCRAASDLSQGPVFSGRTSFITRCNRVRSAEPRTEVFPLAPFLRCDAQPQDEDCPVMRSCPATSLSRPQSH